MIEPRLAIKLRIDALRRQTEAQGGFATIMHRGDDVAGSLLLMAVQRGADPVLFEYMPAFAKAGDTLSCWQKIWPQKTESKDNINDYINKRLKFDPDLWVVELDIVNDAQLVALLTAAG